MKKGKYWFNQLTTSQKIKFRENRRFQRGYGVGWNNLMNDKFESLFDFIMVSFTFRETKQGHHYWMDIANKDE